MDNSSSEKLITQIKIEVIKWTAKTNKDWSALLLIMIGDEDDMGFECYAYDKTGKRQFVNIDNDALFDWIEELQDLTWVPGNKPWVAAALRVVNPSLEHKLDYEFEDMDRWEEPVPYKKVSTFSESL
ncbi:MAG: hypothetical protein V4736_02640 [Bdellovibrionota bacterium]